MNKYDLEVWIEKIDYNTLGMFSGIKSKVIKKMLTKAQSTADVYDDIIERITENGVLDDFIYYCLDKKVSILRNDNQK